MSKNNNGSAALLGLLIVLVIGMMLYFLDMQAIWGPGHHLTQHSNDPKNHPWNMEDLLVPENQTISVPRKGQPELLEPLNLTASVYRKDAPRDFVSITFGKDCRIRAQWSTQYQYENKTYQLQTQMKGNVVPSRIYLDTNKNEDATRLFFIGKGPYTETIQSSETSARTEQGTAYILGWLSPDNTVEGTVTITTDQTWSAVYDFRMTADNSTTGK
jgi:hypothetical protein